MSEDSGRRGARDPGMVGHEHHPQVPASPYLHVVGPQHDPAAEAIAQIDDGHTAAEAHDAGQGHPQRGDEDLLGGDSSVGGPTIQASQGDQRRWRSLRRGSRVLRAHPLGWIQLAGGWG